MCTSLVKRVIVAVVAGSFVGHAFSAGIQQHREHGQGLAKAKR